MKLNSNVQFFQKKLQIPRILQGLEEPSSFFVGRYKVNGQIIFPKSKLITYNPRAPIYVRPYKKLYNSYLYMYILKYIKKIYIYISPVITRAHLAAFFTTPSFYIQSR